MKRFQYIFTFLFLIFLLFGCIQTDQITYPDNHNSILLDYTEYVDIPSLFQYGGDWEAVSKVETKYSSLYKQDNKREMYVFSVPIKELANEKFSFFDPSIQQLDELTYQTNNMNFNVYFNENDISLKYYDDELTFQIEESHSVNLSEDGTCVQYKTEEYDLEVSPAYNAVLMRVMIPKAEKEFKLPIIAAQYKAENEKAGYTILKADDSEKIIICQSIITDSNGRLYTNNQVKVKEKFDQKYIVCSIPPEVSYPIQLEFEVDFYTENMFFDSSAYQEMPRTNSLYNNVSVFDTISEDKNGYTYMKFNVKSFTPKKADLLDSISLSFYVMNCREGTVLEVYSLQEDWCAWTLSWWNRPEHKEKLGEIPLSQEGWYTIDLKEYVERLIENNYYRRVDNSILLKIKDETEGYAVVAASDNKIIPPFFSVKYRTE